MDFHQHNEKQVMYHTKFIRVKDLLLNWHGQNSDVKVLILFGRYFDQIASEMASFLSIEKKLRVKRYPSHEVRFTYYKVDFCCILFDFCVAFRAHSANLEKTNESNISLL